MSYPSRLKLFKAWAKAMEQGATVGKPDYSMRGKRKFHVKRRKKTRRPRRTRRARQKVQD